MNTGMVKRRKVPFKQNALEHCVVCNPLDSITLRELHPVKYEKTGQLLPGLYLTTDFLINRMTLSSSPAQR